MSAGFTSDASRDAALAHQLGAALGDSGGACGISGAERTACLG